MFRILLKKIYNRGWLFLCLLFGCLFAVSSVSAIPLYTGGVVQRLMTRELEQYQEQSGVYPGKYEIRLSTYTSGSDSSANRPLYENFAEDLRQHLDELDIPFAESSLQLSAENISAVPPEGSRARENGFARIAAFDRFWEQTELVSGSRCGGGSGGIHQAVVSEAAAKAMNLSVGDQMLLSDQKGRLSQPFTFEITGIFRQTAESSLYWSDPGLKMENYFVMDWDAFQQEVAADCFYLVNSAVWNISLDYHQIEYADMGRIVSLMNGFQERYSGSAAFESPMLGILTAFSDRGSRYILEQSALLVPVLMMLVFYVFMVSSCIMSQEEGEIAVLKSRGVNRRQVFLLYFCQNLLVAGVSLLAGPPLGLLICRLLGASNGFMEFVGRSALPVRLLPESLLFAAGGALLFLLATLFPTWRASRSNILEFKQQKKKRPAMWKITGADFLLMASSLYSLYTVSRQAQALTEQENLLVSNPLIYLLSAVFILGFTMFCVRVYPLLLKLLYRCVRRFAPAHLYIALTGVSRGGAANNGIIAFLILTTACSVFGSNMARTINQNYEDAVSYRNGADVVLMQQWQGTALGSGGAHVDSSAPSQAGIPVSYREPDFSAVERTEGVEAAAKVLNRRGVTVRTSVSDLPHTQIMAVEPYAFSKTAWMRDDMATMMQYLDFLSRYPTGILLSRSAADALGLEAGSAVSLSWGENSAYLECYVVGVVDCWPTYYPQAEDGTGQHLIVIGLSFVNSRMRLEPYEVWIRRDFSVSTADFYRSLEENGVSVQSLANTGQEMISIKNSPDIQGTNGILTLGYLITLAICLIGYLIFWILSIRGRALQFAVLRAVGLAARKVYAILLWEQLFISIASVAAGVGLGILSSRLFIPVLRITLMLESMPPFRVTELASDYGKLAFFTGSMILTGLIVLTLLVRGIRIHQTLKLGED